MKYVVINYLNHHYEIICQEHLYDSFFKIIRDFKVFRKIGKKYPDDDDFHYLLIDLVIVFSLEISEIKIILIEWLNSVDDKFNFLECFNEIKE